MADVFISYSRPDVEFAHRLHDALEQAGKDVWVDFEDIAPASPWARVVAEAIGDSDAFVFVISPESVRSAQCKVELERAVSLNKRIVPLRLRDTDPKSMPDPLSAHNWVPQIGLFDDDFQTAFRTLITAIETDLAWVREHTRWGQKAADWEESGHDKSFLLSGAELRAAEAWLAGAPGKEPAPTEAQTRLVLESRRRATGRLRLLVGVAAGGLVVAIGLLVLALIQRQSAIDSKKTAQSRELAARAEAKLSSDPATSVQLALQALDTRYTDQAEAALRDALPKLQLGRIVSVGAPVYGAAWSTDGMEFATADARGRVRLWDAGTATPKETWHVPRSEHGSLALSPDGRELAVTYGRRTASLLFTRGQPRQVPLNHGARVNDVAFSANRDEVVTASQDHTAKIWSASTGDKLRRLSAPGVGALTAAAFSPDASEVVTGGADGVTRLWSATTGTQIGPVGPPQARPVGDVAFSNNGKLIATAGVDFQARILKRAGRQAPLPLNGHIGAVHTVSFSPNDSKVVTSSADGTARIWDVATGAQLNTLSGDTGPVLAAAFDPDESGSVLTASSDRTARIWTAASPEAKKTLKGGAAVRSAAFSPDGRRVALATDRGTVRMWHLRPRRKRTLEVSGKPVNAVAFSPDGREFATGGQDGTAAVWNVTSDRGRVTLDTDGSPVHDVAFSPNGREVATGSLNGHAAVFDARSGRRISEFPASSEVINGVSFSPDGKELATASSDGVARIWRLHPTHLVAKLPGAAGPVQDADFSPDGTEVVTAGADRTVRIWDLATLRPTSLSGHTGPVYSAGFSPDGTRIVSASSDGTARIWSVATGRELTALGAPGVPLNRAAFSADGRLVVTANSNGTATIWSTKLAGSLDRIEAIARDRLRRIKAGSEAGT